MTKDEACLSVMGAISMALKDSTLQQGFEIICKNLSELEKENAELKAQIEKMKSCVNCRYCIDEKCPWQPKGCGMKHWELRSNYV